MITHLIEDFTIQAIHAANPSKGWSMQLIQDQAAKEFTTWPRDYVYQVVKCKIMQHCNL